MIDLKGNSAVLRVPITAEDAPNVFVSLMLVKGMDNTPPSFKMGLAKLKVSVADKQLQVQVQPDRSRHRAPRNHAAWRSDPSRPFRSPAIPLPGMSDAGCGRQAGVQYRNLAGARRQGHPDPGRRPGRQTDGPLLQRACAGHVQLASAGHEHRPDCRATAAGGKGGGGGGGGGLGASVRSEFPDVAYWKAVVTGPDGKAQVQITLPDNLTTWVMDARAVTADTLVGQSKTEIVATKDLLVRPILPRFFVQGDQAQIGADDP